MDRYCSDCKYLNCKKKCDGIYECKIIKKPTNSCTKACDKFEASWLNSYEKQKIRNLGKTAKKNKSGSPIGLYVFMLVILILLYLIAVIFGS